ncbi:FAD-binding domain-containing protein [Viridothelium virens]|uniref:Delta(24)-sterol reductase n=1 Tax=Viridothelium virens TaxID=1048519 RepID=A0A6A6HD45_VIRVR|nr:FAD-binding domain-containing protein [Viridothelium virens]
MDKHEGAAKAIAMAVRQLYRRRESYRIFHGSTNSTRPAHKDKVINISALSNVLKIDPVAQSILVEPNVPMDKLVQATLRHGLIPPVVMEFPGITVGGGYAGSAGESSSFRYGYFDQTVNWVEIVLANGDIVKASKSENPALFQGAAGALGTLGITTLIELQLIPAKKLVKTTYYRTKSVKDVIELLHKETENPLNDYVDGILFSKDHGVVIIGKLTDDKPESVRQQTFSGAWDPWFYQYAQQRTESGAQKAPAVDYIPTAEYLFRYDRGGFWVGLEAFRYFGFVPFNRLTRWFLNDFMHTRMLYRALHGSNRSFGFIIQDLSLPYPNAEEFIGYSADDLNIWPLWLCPLREIQPPTFHPSTTIPGPDSSPKPMLNIGLWGRGSYDVQTFVSQNRRLENKLAELGGRKVLYSHTYYTEKEFWAFYDKEWYQNLRERYWATTLPTVFDKVKVDIENFSQRTSRLHWLVSSWPFAGILGIRSAIRSRDYLLHRHPSWKDSVTLRKK